ncbi:MAG: type II 3-dehydroquinate dehydratase [Rhizobiaceae bacterium]
MSKSVMIINGPNLNILGAREPEKYGNQTLADIEAACAEHGKKLGIATEFFQDNSEGAIVTAIQDTFGKHDAIILNAGAYSHTSIAIRDALSAVNLPVYEVHITNILAREDFRHHSYVSELATGVICGLGGFGYLVAMDAIARS